MEQTHALKAFAALAQAHRLSVFRLLIAHGPDGLPAGRIAAEIGISPSTMSFHLSHLEQAGLVRSWRRQRQIFYAVEIEAVRQLLAFLTDECCQGRPDICGDLVARAGLCDEG